MHFAIDDLPANQRSERRAYERRDCIYSHRQRDFSILEEIADGTASNTKECRAAEASKEPEYQVHRWRGYREVMMSHHKRVLTYVRRKGHREGECEEEEV